MLQDCTGPTDIVLKQELSAASSILTIYVLLPFACSSGFPNNPLPLITTGVPLIVTGLVKAPIFTTYVPLPSVTVPVTVKVNQSSELVAGVPLLLHRVLNVPEVEQTTQACVFTLTRQHNSHGHPSASLAV